VPDGARIRLNVVVLPARTGRPAADPLYLLAGGPGQAATRVGALLGPAFAQVRRKRDLVLVDQRGTGGSNPLVCHEEEKPLFRRFDSAFDPEPLLRCLEKLGGDPRHYSTAAATEDLEAVRAALGHERINLWGASYGTRAALAYLRRHGDRVRSVVLDGVVPPEMRLPLDFPRDGQRALEALFSDCQADAACANAFPALRESFARLMERLDQGPITDTVADPRSGAPVQLSLDRAAFSANLRGLLYDVDVASLLPLTLTRAAEGQLDPFVAQSLALSGSVDDGIAQGMMLSVVCAEDLPRVGDEEAEAAAAGTFVGPVVYRNMRRACDLWPHAAPPADAAAPFLSQVPALVLSGALDPATPPRWGALAAAALPNSRHLIAPGVGHGVTPRGCAPRLVAEFLEAGSGAGLDGSCLEKLSRPAFFTSFAGPQP